ncbi:MAG TPA: hypothetical protein P5214_07500 [Rectinema sp.]|nr:hypothetical protein [Rectinema sp.]
MMQARYRVGKLTSHDSDWQRLIYVLALVVVFVDLYTEQFATPYDDYSLQKFAYRMAFTKHTTLILGSNLIKYNGKLNYGGKRKSSNESYNARLAVSAWSKVIGHIELF